MEVGGCGLMYIFISEVQFLTHVKGFLLKFSLSPKVFLIKALVVA